MQLQHRTRPSVLSISILLLVLIGGLALPLGETGSNGRERQEWRFHGRDAGGTRYSPLKQITRENVSRLEVAWTYRTRELEYGNAEARASFSATPLMIDGVVYLSTPSSRVIALDAETGRELWIFDPQEKAGKRQFYSHRGVSWWEGPAAGGSGFDRRILTGTVDGRLFALDAGTGRPRPDFGTAGFVDLVGEPADGVDPVVWRRYRVSSPPAIYRDLVIVGSSTIEYPAEGPPGDVRAFDVRTGRHVWTFHTVPPPGEVGHETWEGDSWKNRSGTNVWTTMSVDVENGLVFLPIGSPAYDFYGGDRKGKNLFGNSLVAVEAATGKLVWYYQMVHHDLWDYDLAAQPILTSVRRDGKDIPAVVQLTKMGLTFVLHRLTGELLFPVEHRPVPASTVPGEHAWPTQPFPVKPPPLSRTSMSRADINRLTPEAQRECTALFGRVVHQGLYVPPGLELTLNFPGTLGGANWSGGAVDQSTGLLYVNVNEEGALGHLAPQPPDAPLPFRRTGPFGEYGRFRTREQGWPCQQPPWGVLHAVNLNDGDIAWSVPLGVDDELAARGVPTTGTQNLGGAIVTAGGLVFIGASSDRRFRAFDAATGRQLWEAQLEAGAHATPMTFEGPKTGRQFVVIAAGGGGFLRELSATLSDTLVAFALRP
jgi:glucose dehydrogenase